MYNYFIYLLLCCLTLPTSAEERDLQKKLESRKQLSIKYKQGANLIFDCEDNHFVCAHDHNVIDCDERRFAAKVSAKELFPCIFIKKFDSIDQCHYEMSEKIYRNNLSPDCLMK